MEITVKKLANLIDAELDQVRELTNRSEGRDSALSVLLRNINPNLLPSRAKWCLLLRIDGQICGWSLLMHTWVGVDFGYVDVNVYTHRDLRRRGIGKALMDRALPLCGGLWPGQGVRVWPWDAGSKAFYAPYVTSNRAIDAGFFDEVVTSAAE